MSGITKRTALAMLACFVFLFLSGYAQELPISYQEVLKSLDRKGDFKDGVLKVNIPRSDLKITVQGVATPTPLGFGGWVAFTKTTQPPNPRGVGVATPCTVILRSLRGILTFSTPSLKSPLRSRDFRTSW